MFVRSSAAAGPASSDELSDVLRCLSVADGGRERPDIADAEDGTLTCALQCDAPSGGIPNACNGPNHWPAGFREGQEGGTRRGFAFRGGCFSVEGAVQKDLDEPRPRRLRLPAHATFSSPPAMPLATGTVASAIKYLTASYEGSCVRGAHLGLMTGMPP